MSKENINVILFIIYLWKFFSLFIYRTLNIEKLLEYLFCEIFRTSYLQDFWTSRKITYLFAERIYFKFIFSR